MRTNFDRHNALVNYSRLLGAYCYTNKFDGCEILKGIKVSCITNLYSKRGADWLWQSIEEIVGTVSGDERQVFAPAVFLLNIQYSMENDRSIDAFHRCNEQFISNCIRLCKSKFHFLHPKRYKFIKKAKQWLVLINESGISNWETKNNASGS